MSYTVFPITRLDKMMATSTPKLWNPQGTSPWVSNGRFERGSFMKRWGYGLYKSFAGKAATEIQAVTIFTKSDGNRYTLVLTNTDVCKDETGAGNTFSYINDTYTTGTITGITGSSKVVTGSSTNWSSSVISVGDYFIIDSDHASQKELDADWAKIKTIDGGTQITLDSAYTGVATTGTYKIRKQYAVPASQRWQFATVNNLFCFTNGANAVQKWSGSAWTPGGPSYAISIDATNAPAAKYCIQYDDRLLIGGLTNPYTVKWSGLLDATSWNSGTDPTAGEKDFIETGDYISGFGNVGNNLVVYKDETIVFGTRTGDANSPFSFDTSRRGVGCVAPYSIVEFMGTNAFIGRDDFYYINGDQVEAFGENIRHDFFELVNEYEIQKTWSGVNRDLYEMMFVANTEGYGKLAFIYNWKHREWVIADYNDDMTALGRGAV